MPILIAGLVLIAVAAVRFRRDAREWSNGALLLLGIVLTLVALVAMASSTAQAGGGGLPVFLVAAVAAMVPLLVLVLTAYLIWNGLTMLRREGFSLGNTLSLLAGLGMLGLIGYLIASVWFIPGQRAFLIGLAIILLLSYPAFAFAAYLLAALLYSRRRFKPADHDIIVLGSSVGGGVIPPLLAARLDRAIAQWRSDEAAGFRSILIPSGGTGADETVSEGEAMGRYLVEHGIPAEFVLVEDRARNTEENLRFGHELARADDRASTLLVVTSEFHAMRAAQYCKDLKLPAHVLGGRTAGYFLPSAFLREFIAILRRNWWVHVAGMGVLAFGALRIVLS